MTAIDPQWKKKNETPLDFIIVGGGAGGAPLAARLAERGFQVLMVEMGPAKPEREAGSKVDPTDVPLLHPETTEDKRHSLRYFVNHYGGDPQDEKRNRRRQNEPDKDSTHPEDEVGIFYPRAQGIGGCTIHNAMITICGPSEDWDEIAESTSDSSWRGDRMRAYFQRLERCTYDKPNWWTRFIRFIKFKPKMGWNNGQHGDQGWLHTSMSDLRLLLAEKKFLKVVSDAAISSLRAGIDSVAELWSGPLPELDPNHWETMRLSQEGISRIPCAIDQRGVRSSPRDRFEQVQEQQSADGQQKCLHSLTDTLVTEILFKGRSRKEACGVQVVEQAHAYEADVQSVPREEDWSPATQKIYCQREVILCGGTFNTPQLLMLSGIGPDEHLKQHGITRRVALEKVGQHLQDRYEVPIVATLKDRFQSLDQLNLSSKQADPVLEEWIRERDTPKPTNVYSTNGGLIGIFKRSAQEPAKPDLFMFALAGYFPGYQVGWSKPAQLAPDRIPPADDQQQAANHKRTLSWLVLKSRSRNDRGTVELKSKNPFRRPQIDFKVLPEINGKNQDLDAIYEGVRFVEDMLEEGKKKGYIESYTYPNAETPIEEIDNGEEKSQATRQWIRDVVWGHHACGTCRLGKNETDSVVDNRFQVHGVKNLRIVDASIFPKIPGYFIVTNIYMISEKAADVISEDHPDHFARDGILDSLVISEALRVNPIFYSNAESIARVSYPVEMEAREAVLIQERRQARGLIAPTADNQDSSTAREP